MKDDANSTAAEKLMVADLALWAGDAERAEQTLRELARPKFLGLPRVRPTSIADWVTRVAEMRLRQLYYRRGVDRRTKFGTTTLEEEKSAQKTWHDSTDLIRITGTTVSPERLLVRGYLTSLDQNTRNKVRRNFEAVLVRDPNASSKGAIASSVVFELPSTDRFCKGRFQYNEFGAISGEIIALPTLAERALQIDALLGLVAQVGSTGKK